MAEYAVIIDRLAGAPSVGAYAADSAIGVNVVRDASVSDDEILDAFREALHFYLETLQQEGMPLPEPLYKIAVVAA